MKCEQESIVAEPSPFSEAESLLTELARSAFPAPINPANAPDAPGIVERYRTLVEQIPAVLFMAQLDGGLAEAYVSPYIETTMGFTQEEWLRDPVRWYRQIHPEDKARWNVEAAQLILSGEPLRSVYRVIARDGHVIWFDCQVKMVR